MAKQHQLLAAPMLADVLGWRARMAAEPVAEALTRMLGRLAERLVLLFERYVQDTVQPLLLTSTVPRPPPVPHTPLWHDLLPCLSTCACALHALSSNELCAGPLVS